MSWHFIPFRDLIISNVQSIILFVAQQLVVRPNWICGPLLCTRWVRLIDTVHWLSSVSQKILDRKISEVPSFEPKLLVERRGRSLCAMLRPFCVFSYQSVCFVSIPCCFPNLEKPVLDWLSPAYFGLALDSPTSCFLTCLFLSHVFQFTAASSVDSRDTLKQCFSPNDDLPSVN